VQIIVTTNFHLLFVFCSNASKLKIAKDKVENAKKEGIDVSDLTKQLDELEKERKKLQDQAEDMKKKEKVVIPISFKLIDRN